jgi:hypothetical protein
MPRLGPIYHNLYCIATSLNWIFGWKWHLISQKIIFFNRVWSRGRQNYEERGLVDKNKIEIWDIVRILGHLWWVGNFGMQWFWFDVAPIKIFWHLNLHVRITNHWVKVKCPCIAKTKYSNKLPNHMLYYWSKSQTT